MVNLIQPQNRKKDIKAALDGYQGFIKHDEWFTEAFQKDLIQNSWGARQDKKHGKNWMCKLEFDSDTHKNFVLRDYNRIDLFKMFNESWQFYSQNKPKLFYKLSDYYSFMPFSYIWSLFFTESNAEALVMDDFVVKNSHIFGKHMNINYQLEKDKKYKILYLDTMSKPVDVSFYMDKIEKNGLLLLKNLDIEGPNMVGWRDLRGRTIGLVKT